MRVAMEPRWTGTGLAVLIRSGDFQGNTRKSCFRVMRLRQQAQLFAALHSLDASGGSELVEGAGTVCLDSVFGDERLRSDLPVTEAAGDQGKNLERPGSDADQLLLAGIGREGFGGRDLGGD